jgi:hypothetical protein
MVTIPEMSIGLDLRVGTSYGSSFQPKVAEIMLSLNQVVQLLLLTQEQKENHLSVASDYFESIETDKNFLNIYHNRR